MKRTKKRVSRGRRKGERRDSSMRGRRRKRKKRN